MTEVPGPSSTQTTPPSEANLEAFKSLFPGVIQDGALDSVRLGELLDTPVSGVKEGKERFGLMWAGKKRAVEALQTPSMAALVPDRDASINWDAAENVFIEGDNLEVLKLLQKAYNDQVKLIYIDPPYNTGNDFVYNDDFSDPLQHYLEVTGQVDAEGNRLVANAETSGRKHSNWLTMMYPRLVLARNLLTQDGAIFISIDDNEHHNLRVLMDEIFGPENFVTSFPWQSRPSVQNDTDVSVSHEYVVCYARNRRKENRRLKNSNADSWFSEPSFVVQPLPTDISRYKLDDGDGRGPYKEDPFDAPNIRPNLTYEIVNPKTSQVYLPPEGRHWRTTPEEFQRYLEDGRISFGSQGTGGPKLKSYYSEKAAFGEVPSTWLSAELAGAAVAGTKELQKLFEGPAPFDTPKPISLMRKILQLGMEKEGLVLDFFAGSGSMGQAVLEQNQEDGGNRRYLLVNLDEPVQENSVADRLGYKSVSEVTIDRLKRCHIKFENSSKGMRIFRLSASAFERGGSQNDEGLIQLKPSTLLANSDRMNAALEILVDAGLRLDASLTTLSIKGMDFVRAGGTVCQYGEVITADILDLIRNQNWSELFLLEDCFAGADSLRANVFYEAKNHNVVLKTF